MHFKYVGFASNEEWSYGGWIYNYTLVLLLSIGIQILEIPICQKNSHVS